jgi:hypothetical protein
MFSDSALFGGNRLAVKHVLGAEFLNIILRFLIDPSIFHETQDKVEFVFQRLIF